MAVPQLQYCAGMLRPPASDEYLPMLSATRLLLERLYQAGGWKWPLLFLGALALVWQMRLQHLDDRLFFRLHSLWQQDVPQAGVGLANFRVKIDALPIAGVRDNLSGLTYDERRDQLWGVLNNPEELLGLSKQGELLARYPLKGFQDVEDLVYLGDDQLLLLEERSHALLVVRLPSTPGPLLRKDARAFTLGIDAGGNQGFEGVGYDRRNDRLFVVKEHSPRSLYEIRGLKASVGGDFNLQVIDHSAQMREQVPASDLSAAHFDARSGHLLLLSDESKLLIELDREGNLNALLPLEDGSAGFAKDVPQAEGMTADDDGNLYLVSEPNLFYALERR